MTSPLRAVSSRDATTPEYSAPLPPTPLQEDARYAPLFQQEWWLRAAAGDCLERAEVAWGGKSVAKLYFVRHKKLGFTLLEMPPYTRTLGPVLTLPQSKPAKYARNVNAAIEELIKALPRFDRLQLTLDPQDPSAFALALCGCSLGQHFTFRMPAAWNPEQHWELLDQKTRNLIRTAGAELKVTQEQGVETLLRLAASFHREKDRTDGATIRRIAGAAQSRRQMMTLCASLPDGRVSAAVTLVWDQSVLYLWLSGRDAAVTHNGASSLLIWRAMLEAHRRGLIFDIDGYHTLGAARFVSRFGLQPQTRTSVVRLSSRGRRIQALGRLIGRGGGFGVQPLTAAFQGA